MGLEKATKLIGAAIGCRRVDRGDRALDVGLPLVALLVVAHEQLELGVAERFGHLMDRAAGVIERAGMKAAVECPAHGVELAGPRRLEEALTGLLVDRGLELSPARKAVRARDEQLRVGELGGGIVSPEGLEALLGLVAEVLQAGASGQLR